LPEVADSVDARACPQGQLISTVYATPLMTPTTDLGMSIRLSIFELRETNDWDIFLGPPEGARAETGGVDQWLLKRRELPRLARVYKVTFASLGYPLSVFNKNSTVTLKPPPPGLIAIYNVPSSRTVCKRTPLEGFVPGSSKGVLLHTALDDGTRK